MNNDTAVVEQLGQMLARNLQQILVMEDNVLLALAMQSMLQEPDLLVLVATTGADATAILEREPISLLLLDVDLPDANGFEFAQRLRADDRFRTLPIIFSTGHDAEEDHAKAQRVGACDFIAKPFSLADLKNRVSEVLRRVAVSSPAR